MVRSNVDVMNGLYTIEETHALITAIMEILLLEDPYACINGFIIIFDIKNIMAQYLFKLTPSVLKKRTMLLEKSMPFRYKAVYFVNAPSIFQNIYNVVYSMLSDKLKQRVSC